MPTHNAPTRRGRDLQAQSMQRHLNNLADKHNFVNLHDTDPKFRWNECMRMLHTPFRERFLVTGDYGPPMYFLELSLMGKMMAPQDRPEQYSHFCAAEELFRDLDETSYKWELESLLCMKLAPQEISLEIPVAVDTVAMYEYYFFDVRSKPTSEIVQYINAKCDPTEHDGVSKYLATLWGPRIYKHFKNRYATLDSEQDMIEVRDMVRRQTLMSITQASLSPSTSLERHLNIATMALREKAINFKIAQHSPTSAKPAGLGDTGDALDGEYHRICDLQQKITESEDIKALQTGGRAAASSLEDKKKTHVEAALETVHARKDLLTPAERASLSLDNGRSKIQ